MKLLNPEETKVEKNKINIEQFFRVKKLNYEETALVSKVNTLRLQVEEEIKKINNNFTEYKQFIEIEKQKLNQEIIILNKKLEEIRLKRIEELKPINIIKDEVEKRANIIEKKEINIKQRELLLLENQKDLLERKEKIIQNEIKIKEKNDKLFKRKKQIFKNEQQSEKLKKDLTLKLDKFNKKVKKTNFDFIQRDKEIKNSFDANNYFKTTLDLKDIEQKKHDLAITDKYKTLARAIEEYSYIKRI